MYERNQISKPGIEVPIKARVSRNGRLKSNWRRGIRNTTKEFLGKRRKISPNHCPIADCYVGGRRRDQEWCDENEEISRETHFPFPPSSSVKKHDIL
jgi:hypothetical protein